LRSTHSHSVEMAEPVGFTASLIAIIQISDRIITSCFEYYRGAKNAKDDIIINVISGLKGIIENLRTFLNAHGEDEILKRLKILN
jgi:hypothetical protein